MRFLYRRLGRRFIKSKDSTAALEFGLVATPFFLLLIPIIEVAMVIFTSLVLENGVIEASRQIRT
ncbi:MAG: TadE/TadG family type IV pilus assembly protein [Hyphomicrobiales bacterium]